MEQKTIKLNCVDFTTPIWILVIFYGGVTITGVLGIMLMFFIVKRR
ncbi:MAG: hypothetical protein M1355_02335 [Patescibacteria group bacterium]|nr:hypothetical protein [Patescibacteria group bacterium]